MRRADPLAGALVLLLAGCAAPGGGWMLPGTAPAPAQPRFADPSLTVESAARAVTAGRSDRREVEERLGPAERLAFDSGWEVWVWRARDKPPGTDAPELVILFDPQGTVSKVRARPAYPRPDS